jgi:hypothetical protein
MLMLQIPTGYSQSSPVGQAELDVGQEESSFSLHNEGRKKSTFCPLTIAKIRFWFLNFKTGQISPSIFETAQI